MKVRRVFRPVAAALLTPMLLLAACAGPHNGERAHDCVASGGKWVADSGGCEIDNKGWCDAHGGKFNACASPCRNAKGPVAACAAICVPVCALPKK
jgi:hypothetical protein